MRTSIADTQTTRSGATIGRPSVVAADYFGSAKRSTRS